MQTKKSIQKRIVSICFLQAFCEFFMLIVSALFTLFYFFACFINGELSSILFHCGFAVKKIARLIVGQRYDRFSVFIYIAPFATGITILISINRAHVDRCEPFRKITQIRILNGYDLFTCYAVNKSLFASYIWVKS